MSTALLLSIVALPASIAAFAVLYVNNDSVWALLWLLAALPTIWVAAAVLSIRDQIRQRSWKKLVTVVVLLAPTVFFFYAIFSPRFFSHQLFSRHIRNGLPPRNGIVFMHKFPVCAETSTCMSVGEVTETQNFKFSKTSENCCSLQVINGQGGSYEAKTFHIFLNGKEIELSHVPLRSRLSLQIAVVSLTTENTLTVRLSGVPDAYIYVIVRNTTTKAKPPI